MNSSSKKKLRTTSFIIIFCNLFFGNAFSNLGISGIPINEIYLLIALLFIGLTQINTILVKELKFNSLFFWYLFGLIYIFFYFIINGIWAIRDGLFIIDSLYLIVGYYLFDKINDLIEIKSFLKLILIVSFFYIFFFLFSDFFIKLSPIINTYSGNQHSLFFNFLSIKITLVWSAFIGYIFYFNHKIKSNFFFITLTLSSFIFFQSRQLYISTIAGIFILFLNKKIKFKNFFSLFLFLILFIILFSLMNFEIKGRLETFNFKFLYQHFLTLLTPFYKINVDYEILNSQIGSAIDRLNWWNSVLENSTVSIKNFLIGTGFGKPLINFYTGLEDIPAREPHNSYLTIIGRVGYLGLLFWSLIHIKIFKYIYKTLKIDFTDKYLNNIIVLILIYLAIIIVSSLGDSMFTMPNYSIPFYFFVGVVLKIYKLSQSPLNLKIA